MRGSPALLAALLAVVPALHAAPVEEAAYADQGMDPLADALLPALPAAVAKLLDRMGDVSQSRSFDPMDVTDARARVDGFLALLDADDIRRNTLKKLDPDGNELESGHRLNLSADGRPETLTGEELVSRAWKEWRFRAVVARERLRAEGGYSERFFAENDSRWPTLSRVLKGDMTFAAEDKRELQRWEGQFQDPAYVRSAAEYYRALHRAEQWLTTGLDGRPRAVDAAGFGREQVARTRQMVLSALWRLERHEKGKP